jgi:hypothetical protein
MAGVMKTMLIRISLFREARLRPEPIGQTHDWIVGLSGHTVGPSASEQSR